MVNWPKWQQSFSFKKMISCTCKKTKYIKMVKGVAGVLRDQDGQ